MRMTFQETMKRFEVKKQDFYKKEIAENERKFNESIEKKKASKKV